jgi:quercetin dioxygenase-like cupin family protein
MKSAVHRHAGPEAWYVLSGEQCLETPSGKSVIGTGQSGLVPGGPPMILMATGTRERRMRPGTPLDFWAATIRRL